MPRQADVSGNNELIEKNGLVVPEEKNPCLEPKCPEAAAFVCKASLLGKKFGCGQHFCKKHKGDFSIFFFQKL